MAQTGFRLQVRLKTPMLGHPQQMRSGALLPSVANATASRKGPIAIFRFKSRIAKCIKPPARFDGFADLVCSLFLMDAGARGRAVSIPLSFFRFHQATNAAPESNHPGNACHEPHLAVSTSSHAVKRQKIGYLKILALHLSEWQAKDIQ
jgi:hypothetical protein